MNAPDKGIPLEIVEHAKCIAVIPNQIKAGFVVAAKFGKGVATCHTERGWSAPAFFTITGGGWGAQIGIASIDNVLMIMNQRGMDHLLSAKFQIGADASAAAGPVGRHAAAGTDWKMETEILSYARARGVFAGVSLDGAVVHPDQEATKIVYGKLLPPREILTGKVQPPETVRSFLAAVREVEEKAKKES
jgi:lipid-binding SYLF domain-containing protein